MSRGASFAAGGSVTAEQLAALGVQPGAVRWIGPTKIGCFDGQQLNATFAVDAPTGGTFTLTINGETTETLAFDASEGDVVSALEAIVGAGNVSVSNQFGSPLYAYVTFRNAVATGLITCDGAALTGPEAPYTMTSSGAGNWSVPLLTPAVGDVIEDFMHHIPVAFESGDLLYTDNPSDSSASRAWTNPSTAQDVPEPGGIDLAGATTEFDNFTGYGAASVRSQPTSLLVLLAAWAKTASSQSEDFYSNLPAVATNAAPIYALVENIDPDPSQGEVWVWTKISTPAEAA